MKALPIIALIALVVLIVPVSAESWFYFTENSATNTTWGPNQLTNHEGWKAVNGNEADNWQNNGVGGWVTFTNPDGICYNKLRVLCAAGDNENLTVNGEYHSCTATYANYTVSGCGPIYITDDTASWGRVAEVQGLTGYIPPAPVANFNGIPVSGLPPLTEDLTDTSTGAGINTWNWSGSGPGSLYFSNISSRNTSLVLNTPGNYTIVHGVSSPYGSNISTKTDYIYVINSTGLTTTHITAINGLTGHTLAGAEVDLYDVQNTSWTNTTTTDGTGSITTLSSHTINAYASYAGFDPNYKLGLPAGTWDSILLLPPSLRNVSAGNVTLYVYVYDSVNHQQPIKGAQVTVAGPTMALSGTTNDAGLAQFAVTNKTTFIIDVSAIGLGYSGQTQSVSSGTGSGGTASVTATFYLLKNGATVVPTQVITTLPGGGTPTPIKTILPGCEDPTSAACQASQNNFSMSWLSSNALILIQVAFIFTILYIAGWKP